MLIAFGGGCQMWKKRVSAVVLLLILLVGSVNGKMNTINGMIQSLMNDDHEPSMVQERKIIPQETVLDQMAKPLGFGEQLPSVADIQMGIVRLWQKLFESLGVGGNGQVTTGLQSTASNNRNGTKEKADDGGGDLAVLFGSLLNIPWWQRENVCKRDLYTSEEEVDPISSENYLPGGISSNCLQVEDTYRCSTRIRNGDMVQVKTTVYACCEGWYRNQRSGTCSSKENPQQKDVLDRLEAMDAKLFVHLLKETRLDATLVNGNGKEFTIFLPPEESLRELTELKDIGFDDGRQYIRNALAAHILPRRLPTMAWEDEQQTETVLDEHFIRFNFYADPEPVLLPKDLEMELNNEKKHHTVLAFTDSAFHQLPSSVKSILMKKRSCTQGQTDSNNSSFDTMRVKNFLYQTILPHSICSPAIRRGIGLLGDGGRVKDLTDRWINVTRMSGSNHLVFNGVEAEKTDTVATNGVLHLLNQLKIHNEMLSAVDLASETGGELFVSYLKESAGLMAEVQDFHNYTLLIPPAKALRNALEERSPEERAKILRNHIVLDTIRIDGKRRSWPIQTLNHQTHFIKIEPARFLFSLDQLAGTIDGREGRISRIGNVVVGNTQMSRYNLFSCDGAVHYIQDMLITESESIESRMAKNLQISQFFDILQQSGILFSDHLSKDERDGLHRFMGTIMAPTNAAMNEYLSDSVRSQLLKNPNAMLYFVQKHILQDEKIESRNQAGRMRVGGAYVSKCDIQAANGILHIVDKPLMSEQEILNKLAEISSISSRSRSSSSRSSSSSSKKVEENNNNNNNSNIQYSMDEIVEEQEAGSGQQGDSLNL